MLQFSPSLNQINYLNIFLMVLSSVLAFLFPFELFLLSFVFLGPLHYLTEISWLEKKDFFMIDRKNLWLFIIPVLAILLYDFFPSKNMKDIINILFFSILCLGFACAFTKKLYVLVLVFTLSYLLIYFLNFHQKEAYLIVFSIFLPTIIHITIFTGLFILSGIFKSNNISGWLSFIVFILCSMIYFLLPYNFFGYQTTSFVQESYYEFIVLNKKFSDFFHFGQINKLEDIFNSNEGVVIMQFIAFSYTYHYLNWFTKTSIIKWHEVSKTKMTVIIMIYFFVLYIFFFENSIGLKLLTLLSFLHVILEFPLNAVSIKKLISK